MLLWFGSWKNAFSNYAPAWVKQDTKRFRRAQAADGAPLEILSTLSEEDRRSDSRAFASLMRHVHEKDAEFETVLMVRWRMRSTTWAGEGIGRRRRMRCFAVRFRTS